jgi:hypothetical protein
VTFGADPLWRELDGVAFSTLAPMEPKNLIPLSPHGGYRGILLEFGIIDLFRIWMEKAAP